MQAPEAWCAALTAAGCATARHIPLDCALWPATLLVAIRGPDLPAAAEALPEAGGLVLFAAPDDPLAAALAERQGMLRVRPGARLVPRLRRLEVGCPGLINSLAWQDLVPRPPGPGEVAIEVRAAALNFRDVMWAQGLLPDEALLDGLSSPSLGDGVDDLAPGDRVIAAAPAALATHVVTFRTGVMRMPAGLDFAAAATIPVACMTAVYALGHLARLEPGERVLIHGGAGGVGLAAIQYALQKGAVVYATAGSVLRRQMLRMLGVTGVFDSRSAGFVDDLLAATGGEGVDVVLNSLSGELMQQSLRLLRPFGRFLEIGKRDLYRNTPVGIRPLRHNAAYFAVDSDALVARRPALGRAVLEEVAALLADGRLQPLPYRPFGFAEVVEAFRLLQSSGHVGKVVLLPEPAPAAQVVLVEEVAAILRQTASAIDVNRPIAEFGVDSLMGMELRTALESRLGVQLPLLALSGATTLGAMSARLLRVLHAGEAAPADDLIAVIERHEGMAAAAMETTDMAAGP